MADSELSKSDEIPEGKETVIKEPVVLEDTKETKSTKEENVSRRANIVTPDVGAVGGDSKKKDRPNENYELKLSLGSLSLTEEGVRSKCEGNALKGANIVATDVGAAGGDSEEKDRRNEFRLGLGSLNSTEEDVRPNFDRSTHVKIERITAAFSEACKDVEDVLEETEMQIEICQEYDEIRAAMGKVFERYCSVKRILRDMEGIVLDKNIERYKEECRGVHAKVKVVQQKAKEAMKLTKIDQHWEKESIRSHSTQKSSGSRQSSAKSIASKRSSSSRGSASSKKSSVEDSLTVQKNLAKLKAIRELRQKQIKLDFEDKKRQAELGLKQAELDFDREIIETEAVLKVCEKAEGVSSILYEDCEVPKVNLDSAAGSPAKVIPANQPVLVSPPREVFIAPENSPSSSLSSTSHDTIPIKQLISTECDPKVPIELPPPEKEFESKSVGVLFSKENCESKPPLLRTGENPDISEIPVTNSPVLQYKLVQGGVCYSCLKRKLVVDSCGPSQTVPVLNPQGFASRYINNHSPAKITSSKQTSDRPQGWDSWLPRAFSLEIGDFWGEEESFHLWEIAFTRFVRKHGLDIVEKMSLLSMHVKGEARDLIKGFLRRPSESLYLRIWEVLRKRYGDDVRVVGGIREKLKTWPRIDRFDGIAMQRFADFLVQVSITKEDISSLNYLDDPSSISEIASVLPDGVIEAWLREVVLWGREAKKHCGKMPFSPPFDRFVEFVNFKADEMNIPEYRSIFEYTKERPDSNNGESDKSKVNSPSEWSKEKEKSKPVVAFVSETEEVECINCQGAHFVSECDEISKLQSNDERREVFKKLGLCFGCGLKGSIDHLVKTCPERATCKICFKKHPTCLHYPKPEKLKSEECMCIGICQKYNQGKPVNYCSILPVKLRSKKNPNKFIECYCVLDTQSSATFVSEKVVNDLGIQGKNTSLSLTTMSQINESIDTKMYGGLEVFSHDGKAKMKVPFAYSRNQIPCSKAQIPCADVCRNWRHLEKVADMLPEYRPDLEVGMLIGTDIPKALCPLEVIRSNGNAPYAQRNIFGWSVIGNLCKQKYFGNSNVVVNRFAISEIEQDQVVVERSNERETAALVSKANDATCPDMILHALSRDFVEHDCGEKKFSAQDRAFIRKVTKGLIKGVGCHYQMPLPVEHEPAILPNNKTLVVKRANRLMRRLLKNEKFKDAFSKNMTELIQNFAEKVSKDELNSNDGSINYIPYLAVVTDKKPG